MDPVQSNNNINLLPPARPNTFGTSRITKIGVAALYGAAVGAAAGFLFGVNLISMTAGAVVFAVICAASAILLKRPSVERLTPAVTVTPPPPSRERIIGAWDRLSEYVENNLPKFETENGVFKAGANYIIVKELYHHLTTEDGELNNFHTTFTFTDITCVIKKIVGYLNILGGVHRNEFMGALPHSTSYNTEEERLSATKHNLITLIKKLNPNERRILQKYIQLNKLVINSNTNYSDKMDRIPSMMKRLSYTDRPRRRGLEEQELKTIGIITRILVDHSEEIFHHVNNL